MVFGSPMAMRRRVIDSSRNKTGASSRHIVAVPPCGIIDDNDCGDHGALSCFVPSCSSYGSSALGACGRLVKSKTLIPKPRRNSVQEETVMQKTQKKRSLMMKQGK